MSDTELKACPFCGESEAIRCRHLNSDASQWGVTCDGCDAEGPWRFGEEDAIALWNRRAQDDVARDAERYRWLRSVGGRSWDGATARDVDYDAATDAAIAAAARGE